MCPLFRRFCPLFLEVLPHIFHFQPLTDNSIIIIGHYAVPCTRAEGGPLSQGPGLTGWPAWLTRSSPASVCDRTSQRLLPLTVDCNLFF